MFLSDGLESTLLYLWSVDTLKQKEEIDLRQVVFIG